MDRTGVVATPYASRYLQQLCKHWGHRFTVDFDAMHGTVDFGDNSSLDLAAAEGTLTLVLHAPAEALDDLQAIVEEHVSRFAHREDGLIYRWTTSPGLSA